mmetsp:Transcript_50771/g.99509  ORF Transcript_50771/g.99509 Transcript_50771/m.99509 type:complete len:791 (-) Transcript_50771:1399-3771(-)|eukprot:CAMPEP_0175122894 /NCGR_PEP_ID=MMETSP0087-20121206/1953_1 /TAXON_ID=136419 /ORGANISM="Unknown Unknown, Strain D1" /LENGTH=790 /DNA_ID=CAMNT_0016404549 /DNA_START=19 /DNA_END=2391 /DNA_ORIENTATION=+
MTDSASKLASLSIQESNERKETGEGYDILYLCSQPLIGRINTGWVPLEPLDFETEKKIFTNDVIKYTNFPVNYRFDFATSDNLRRAVTMGCRCVHYTGHGMTDCLAFEDEVGKMHSLKPTDLKELLKAGDGVQSVKFVFVAACHSQESGQAFVDAGVPHVIAVQKETDIADQACQVFMKQFYPALFMHKSIQDAFEIGQQSVHAHPATRGQQSHKFILMPEGADHSEVIFPTREGSASQDKSDTPAKENLDPQAVIYGRAKSIQTIVESILKDQTGKRLIVVAGEAGTGKSVVALEAARYMWARRCFPDGVFSINLALLRGSTSICKLVARELEDSKVDLQSDTIGHDVRKLANALQKKQALFVFDNADVVSDANKDLDDNPYCLLGFLAVLLRKCHNIKFVVTCRDPAQLDSVTNKHVQRLENLTPEDSVKLFWNRKQTQVTLEDFKARSFIHLKDILLKHPALTDLKGHPGMLTLAASKLSKDGLDQLRIQVQEILPQYEEDKKIVSVVPSEYKTTSNLTVAINSERSNSIGAPPPLAFQHTAPLLSPEVQTQHPQTIVPLPFQHTSSHPQPLQHLSCDQFWTQRISTTHQSVEWNSFWASLTKHFSTVSPFRSFSQKDMSVIYGKLLNFWNQLHQRGGVPQPDGNLVHQFAFQHWYTWYLNFCDVVQKSSQLWNMRHPQTNDFDILHGLIGREESTRRLQGQEDGTFILRFSENNNGIAIDFVEGGHVTHTLIEVNNGRYLLTLKGDAKVDYSTLPELLMKCLKLKRLFPNLDKVQAFSTVGDHTPH